MEKKSLSLSPLFISPTPKRFPENASMPVRVISQPFPVPGLSGKCRYGCCEKGLALLENSQEIPSGTLTLASFKGQAERDGRSGAIILSPPGKS